MQPKIYHVKVSERLARDVFILAHNATEAEANTEDRYDEGYIVLDSDDIDDTSTEFIVEDDEYEITDLFDFYYQNKYEATIKDISIEDVREADLVGEVEVDVKINSGIYTARFDVVEALRSVKTIVNLNKAKGSLEQIYNLIIRAKTLADTIPSPRDGIIY